MTTLQKCNDRPESYIVRSTDGVPLGYVGRTVADAIHWRSWYQNTHVGTFESRESAIERVIAYRNAKNFLTKVQVDVRLGRIEP